MNVLSRRAVLPWLLLAASLGVAQAGDMVLEGRDVFFHIDQGRQELYGLTGTVVGNTLWLERAGQRALALLDATLPETQFHEGNTEAGGLPGSAQPWAIWVEAKQQRGIVLLRTMPEWSVTGNYTAPFTGGAALEVGAVSRGITPYSFLQDGSSLGVVTEQTLTLRGEAGSWGVPEVSEAETREWRSAEALAQPQQALGIQLTYSAVLAIDDEAARVGIALKRVGVEAITALRH
ncbi:hypothetical protein [Chitinolyticbacter meiyuanensis]|uniref:hypothetical protein n=1 Tax=Chitinolyticbacter meiyuanensis TaxID=682798 RepID=UPI0011E5AAF4|nr:hypothetical protein [Chitinolyticbacter meiyuanensis]